MTELINLIDDRISNYSKELDVSPEAELLQSIYRVIEAKGGYEKFSQSEVVDLMKASFIIFCPNIDFTDVLSMTESTLELHRNLLKVKERDREDYLYTFLDLFRDIRDDKLEGVLEIYNPNSPYYKNSTKYLDQFQSSSNCVFVAFGKGSNLRKLRKQEEKKLKRIDYVNLLAIYNKKFFDGNHEKMYMFYQLTKRLANNPELARKFISFTRFNLINSGVYPQELIELKELVEKKLSKIKHTDSKRMQENLAIANKYATLKNKLLTIKDDEVVNASIVSDFPDDLELLELVYKWALEHNDKIYNKLSKFNKSDIESLCVKYNFNVSCFDDAVKDSFYSLSYNKLEKFFKYCQKRPIMKSLFNNKIIVNIISLSDYDTIDNVIELINNNIIHANLLINHPAILLDGNNLIRNISMLRSMGVNTLSLSDTNGSILMMDNASLMSTSSLLSRYLSYDDLKKIDNFEIFNNNKYFDYIDMIIENGLYKDMVDDFSLINEDTYDMILAIMFSDDIGFDYRDSNGEIIGSIKKLDKFRKLFSIGSESLEEYYPTYDKSIINSSYLSIINDSLNNKIDDQLLELDVIKKLDQHFLDSGLTYNIGGYVISRLKVLRYLTTLDISSVSDCEKVNMIFNAIIINKIIDDGGVKKIERELSNVFSNFSKKVFVK